MENDPFKEIQRQIEGLKRQLQEKDEMIMDLDGQITELTAYINMLHERFTGLSLEMSELFDSNPSKKRGTYARDSIVYHSGSEEKE
ncbi:hypothetical protein [Methanococcoides sp. NM1]|uniref:hypothetical protein n=1 Tax=Methanococcoides sp. NM1 TaxID=1201013 RepID=UPI001082ACAE|nr:hypothetical protein [Methanococcoides sp. NM1]